MLSKHSFVLLAKMSAKNSILSEVDCCAWQMRISYYYFCSVRHGQKQLLLMYTMNDITIFMTNMKCITSGYH